MTDPASAHLREELEAARCAVPFQFLGLQQRRSGKGLLLRAWMPGVDWVEVMDLGSRRNLGRLERVGESGLYVKQFPRRRRPFPYRLRCGRGGEVVLNDDAFQFRRSVFAKGPEDRNRLYRYLGAQMAGLERDGGGEVAGVRFCVRAPSARSVSVVGEFNGWDGRCHPMQSSYEGEWRLFVPGLGPGTLYKFELKGPDGSTLPLKSDPFGVMTEQPPGNASIVCATDGYEWHDDEWMRRRHAAGYRDDVPVSVYEVHAGSWRRRDGRPLSYRELADELVPYVRDLGFTHVEFMPLTEHPFVGSWGYQPTGLFSACSRYGTPDDLRHLVDRCHDAGIGVILDWVPAHFPADAHGIGRFDGTPLYEHADPRRGWHPDWDTYVYDFGSGWVRDFLVSSAMYWVEQFHVDGIRVDAVASMLYLDYSREPGQWLPNMFGGNQNLEAIDFLKRLNEVLHTENPGVLTIAEESTAWPGVTRPTYEGGLGFGYKWNMGWMHDTLKYMARDPVYRKYHHGELTFGLVYTWDEHFILPLSHDEVVYGKGSLLSRMPGDDWQRLASLRLYFAFLFAHPGKKLLFMGSELAQPHEWHHDAELSWELLSNAGHRGVQDLLRDLNRVYRSTPALWQVDHSAEGFEWIDYSDAEQGVIAFVRHGSNRGDHVVAVLNFTPVVRRAYRVGMPDSCAYRAVLNTDSRAYGGSDVGNLERVEPEPEPFHGRRQSVLLELPPLGALYLAPERGT